MNDDSFPNHRCLGRTGLTVSTFGIGGGNGVSSEDVEWAVDQGINFLFYSSDLHHVLYARMSSAIRRFCKRGSHERQRIILACATYIMRPHLVLPTLFDLFAELGVDYIDLLMWGMVDSGDAASARTILNNASSTRGTGTPLTDSIERLFGASDELRRMGAVRFVGMSFHDPILAAEYAASGQLDVVMIRTNLAHRRARDVVLKPLSKLSITDRPGTVVFNATRGANGPFWARHSHGTL